MAIEKISVKRVFVLEKNGQKIALEDPNENLTPDAVRKFYCGQYPELNNSSVTGPEWKGEKMQFTFKTSVGTKG